MTLLIELSDRRKEVIIIIGVKNQGTDEDDYNFCDFLFELKKKNKTRGPRVPEF